MKRAVIGAAVAAASVVAMVLIWNTARQEREFRRLIAVGDAALTRDQTFEAIEAFSGALALKNDSMLAHLKRGETYRRRGEFNAALRDLRDAAALDPSAPQPLELLGDVNSAMGRYERATEDYRRFIALEDRAPLVLYKLALAYYRNGRATLAIDALRRAVAIDDRFTEAHYLLGMSLRDRKRDDEALRALNRAVDINPAFAAAREELADLYAASGRVRESIEQLEALAALEPSKAERLVGVGLAYARLGRTDAAILTLGRAAERFAEEPTVYTALGRVWLESAELRNDDVALSKAVEALEPAAGRAAASSETLALYGRALFLSGKVVEAERVLRQAVTRLPLDPRALAHLSSAAERLGHLAEGRDALIQYVSLVDDEKTRMTLSARIADLSLRINDPARAAKWAQRAIDGENASAYSLGLLADAQMRLGQRDAARETLTQALAREPRNRTLLRLRQRLGT